MSDYEIVNGKRVRACKYECKTMVAWDDANKYFIEVDNDEVHHTPERSKAFKELGNGNANKNNNLIENQKQKFTLYDVTKKLESIGIIINVERLMAQK